MKDKCADKITGLERKTTFRRAVPAWRRGWAIVAVLAFAAAFSWTAAATAQQGGGDKPIISVDSRDHDFGTTWIGPTLEHTFKITNKGSKTLEILRLRPSCGCIVAGKYPVKIEPGQTGDFPFSINSHKVRGRYQKSIRITSNDPENSVLELKLHGECKRYVDVMPAAANFGNIFGDEKHEKVLKVTNNTEEPLELKLDVPSKSKFEFELVETDPGDVYELHVSASAAGADPGMLRATAVLKTNNEAQKQIEINAWAAVPRRLEVQPAGIRIRKPDLGKRIPEAASRVVRFTNYGSTPAKVLEAAVDDPNVKVTVDEQTPGKEYEIRLDLPAQWQPPAEGRTLTLKTDDKESPTIKVPITGEAPPRRTAERTPQKREGPNDLVGKPAPKFELATAAGEKFSNETFADTVTVLDFFSPGCGHCMKQIPRVEQIRKTYADKGVRFVAVGQGAVDAVKAKVDTLGFQGELAIDGNRAAGSLFKVRGVPAMVILGKTGKVEAVNIGNMPDLETRMTGQLDALLAGKAVPKYESRAAQRPRQGPDDLVGKPAPKFELTTTAGKKLSNQTATDTVTVLDFFSTRCGHCMKQIPRVEQIRKTYADKGVRFVAVGQGPDEAAVTAKVDTLGFQGELVTDISRTASSLFKVRGVPAMVILGKTGKVEAVNVGNMPDLETRMTGQLDALLAGKPVPE